MKYSRKNFKTGKKAYLKECSNEYWDLVIEEIHFNEMGREWMWE